MMKSAAAFELSNQRVSYGEHIVLEVDHLRINYNEKVALVGKSGSGKSTLLRKLRGLAPQQCTICPQHLGLVPSLSVFHNIYMGSLNRHPSWFNLLNLVYPNSKIKKEIDKLCGALELTGKEQTSIDRLSGGQMQRVALGRAIYQQADVFLGDEPVSSVDSHQAERLLELIKETHQTVVIAIHDQHLALAYFDRVIGLQNGKIVLDKASDQISANEISSIYQA